jgi:hypothetical protein
MLGRSGALASPLALTRMLTSVGLSIHESVGDRATQRKLRWKLDWSLRSDAMGTQLRCAMHFSVLIGIPLMSRHMSASGPRGVLNRHASRSPRPTSRRMCFPPRLVVCIRTSLGAVSGSPRRAPSRPRRVTRGKRVFEVARKESTPGDTDQGTGRFLPWPTSATERYCYIGNQCNRMLKKLGCHTHSPTIIQR